MDAKVYSVREVSLAYTQSVPPSVVIGATGTAPTSGWSNGRLIPRVYAAPPDDGIWDFDFIATSPLGIALKRPTVILSAPLVVQIPEWFQGARVFASTNSESKSTAAANSESVPLVNFSARSLDGSGETVQGGVDNWPWIVVVSANEEDDGLPTNETALQRTVGSLLGMFVRVHPAGDAATEDYRKNRINFVIADGKPTILDVYIG